jgi:endonuclease YncB( thermonuclease family)
MLLEGKGPLLRSLGLTILFAGFLCPLAAARFEGKVVVVAAGDRLAVLDESGRQVELRLYGIVCPELDSPVGEQARRFTSAMVLDKTVSVTTYGRDYEGQSIGRIVLGETDLLLELLRAGLAEYDRENWDDDELARAEGIARAAGIGVWAYGEPDRTAAADTEATDDEVVAVEEEDTVSYGGDIVFDKVEFLEPQEDGETKQREALLSLEQEEISITDQDGEKEFVRIPYHLIDELVYERSSHPRWESVAAPSIFGSFGDRKKHWLKISWKEEGEAEFCILKLDKKNYQEIVAACESRSGRQVYWILGDPQDIQPPF